MSTDQTEWGSLTIALLRQATDVYLGIAYPDGPPPEAVRRRLDWPEAVGIGELLAGRPFERSRPTSGDGTITYSLRLGNAGYPNMKLQLQPWPTGTSGFLLLVNSHDQVMAQVVRPEEQQAFRALQAENQRIKEAIEAAWDARGLPTFTRYLNDYIEANPGTV